MNEKNTRSHIEKNLSHYLKIVRWKTPNTSTIKIDSCNQTHFKRMKEVCQYIHYLEQPIEKSFPSSTTSNKRFIIVNIANPNEWDHGMEMAENDLRSSLYL
jgi:hypothetical protein